MKRKVASWETYSACRDRRGDGVARCLSENRRSEEEGESGGDGGCLHDGDSKMLVVRCK